MKYYFYVLLIFAAGCLSDRPYAPADLVKITEEEYFDRSITGAGLYSTSITYRNQRGDILTNNNAVKLLAPPRTYGIDFYKNENNQVVEAVLRPYTARDSLLDAQLKSYFDPGTQL